MNSQHYLESQIDQVIEFVTGEFIRLWHVDNQFRIEDFADRIPALAKTFGVDAKTPAIEKRLLSELLMTEMELRARVGKESVGVKEYKGRFEFHTDLVEDAWNWLRKQQHSTGEFEVDGQAAVLLPVNFKESEPDFPSQLGPYKEISFLAQGGFGTVCRAVDDRDGSAIALKFPRQGKSNALSMLIKEANRALRLDHPAIVKTRNIERSNGYVAVVQDFIEGTNLRVWMSERRAQEDVIELVATLADALAYAHSGENGIYHLDLKPENILIDREDRPFIADFGLALTEDEQLRAARIRCGSRHYMSPEQAQALTGHYDGRTDIWSLGVILYELLTDRKPFRGPPGCSPSYILELIETNDPKPPRQIDNSIDPELQRICMKCLNRRQSERYDSADQLARDLRLWLTDPPAQLPNNSEFIPQGLRSFDACHSDFFFELMPGPKDRNGIPSSILFWKSRICEPVAPENRIPIGVIYGPSGSGKSSFVKAGLIPQIRSSSIRSVYVESTTEDTEIRLLKALRSRDHFPKIPRDLSLPEIFRGLKKGLWGKSKSVKLLIVFDQFEQYLAKSEDFYKSQLVKAMRFCDGIELQCLLLARDDFLMGLTRFYDALDFDMREGVNAQAIDLFDKVHARKILVKLGKAYNNLPSEFPESRPAQPQLTEQDRFLDQVIEQMAKNNQVICVRLILFVEMFKHRTRWIPAELESVGGVTGSGEEFLEAAFGKNSPYQRYRSCARPAKELLEALLPENGLEIRGSMKSEENLRIAAGLRRQPEQFARLTNILDSELRLITKTDPTVSDYGASSDQTELKYFQLTHDSLVDSVRNWIRRTKSGTVEGRTGLMVKDRAAEWRRDPSPRRLLGPAELARVYLHKRNLKFNRTDDQFVRASSSRAFKIFGASSVALAMVLAFALLFVNQAKQELVKEKVQSLLNAKNAIEFTEKADELKGFGPRSREVLLSQFQNSVPDEKDRRRLRLALFHLGDDTQLDDLIQDLKTAPVGEFRSYLKLLKSVASDVSRAMWQVVDGSEEPGVRFRAAAWLADHDPSSPNWNQTDKSMFFDYMFSLNVSELRDWLKIIAPVHGKLAAESNLEYHRAGNLARQLTDDECVNEKAREADECFDRQAFAAILLFKLGDTRLLIDSFANRRDPTIRSFIVHSSFSPLISEDEILQQLARQDAPPNVLSGFWLMAGRRTELSTEARFLERAHRILQSSRNSQVRSATKWFCRQRGSNLPPLNEAIESLSPFTDWVPFDEYQDQFGHTFVVVPFRFHRLLLAGTNICDEGCEVDRLIAVSTTEETYAQLSNWPEFKQSSDSHQPVELSRDQIMRYCNYLSQRAGTKPSDYCYEENESGVMVCREGFLLRTGYRLPVQAEWTLACEGGSTTRYFTGRSNKHIQTFGWYRDNVKLNYKPVQQLAPNPLGLFDMLGNCWEWCHVTDINSKLIFKPYGGNPKDPRAGKTYLNGFPPEQAFGFRLVRTLAIE